MLIFISIVSFLLLVAIYDFFSKKHTIRSNYPVVGRLRYLLEKIGPELRQYWVAHNREESPFHRVWKSYIYASAKGQNNLSGFGSDADFTKPGHFYIKNSTFPTNINNTINSVNGFDSHLPCTKTIGERRAYPYKPNSVINISAMSYGSLGKRATLANNIGAKLAGAYHNVGEGGFSEEYHGNGADIVFQIGTGYFGCGTTDENGFRHFSMKKLMKLISENGCIKMIEVKLSQGAKPGKGGILPGNKVTPEIAKIRGIEVGKDVHSPAYHSAFSNVDELVDFIELIASETGLPVGIKSAIGKLEFWYDLADKMVETGKGPDFITIDGGEGGTGAAPSAFADNVSLPFDDAFTSVYKIFYSKDIEDKVVWIASGKLGHPTIAAKAFAMGADMINIAREVMISAGCIQAQVCHTGNCPAGIATHKWWLEKGFDVEDKQERIARFIKTLRKDLIQVTHAAGYTHPSEFNTDDVVVNTGDPTSKKTLEDIYGYKKYIHSSQKQEMLL
jgi:glutamate synthase domain-containing protein 2